MTDDQVAHQQRQELSPAARSGGRRRAALKAGLMLAALILGAAAGLPRSALAQDAPAPGPLVTYKDAAGRYQFMYPQDWRLSNPHGAEVEAAAPDGNAALWMVAAPTATANTTLAARIALPRWVAQLGVPAGGARYGQYTTGTGVTMSWGFTAVRLSGGTTGLAMVLGTASGGQVFALYGLIGNMQASTWTQDSRQVGASIVSLLVGGSAVPGGNPGSGTPPAAGVAATCRALKQQMTNFSQIEGLYRGKSQFAYMNDDLTLAAYYDKEARWYHSVIMADYQRAVRLHCFG
jgi:hypothetical protein